jgi:hypothetical protein
MKRKLDASKLNIRAIIANANNSTKIFAPYLTKRIKQPQKIKRVLSEKTLYLSQ